MRSESERAREERSAVLVDRSTEDLRGYGDANREGGEAMLKRPTVGKEKPSITRPERNNGRYIEVTNRFNTTSGNRRKGESGSGVGIHDIGASNRCGVFA